MNKDQPNFEVAAPLPPSPEKQPVKEERPEAALLSFLSAWRYILLSTFIGVSFVSSAFLGKQAKEAFLDGCWGMFLWFCVMFGILHLVANSLSGGRNDSL